MAGGVRAEPAACGTAFAILLRRAIQRGDELRIERNGMTVSACHKMALSTTWKYSVPPLPRSRREHRSQWILSGQEYLVRAKTIEQAAAVVHLIVESYRTAVSQSPPT